MCVCVCMCPVILWNQQFSCCFCLLARGSEDVLLNEALLSVRLLLYCWVMLPKQLYIIFILLFVMEQVREKQLW